MSDESTTPTDGGEHHDRFDQQALVLQGLADAVNNARDVVERGRLEVRSQIEQARAEAELQAAARERENKRRNRNTLIVAAAIGAVGVILGAVGLTAARDARHVADHAQDAAELAHSAAETAQEAIDLANEQRADARQTSCEAARVSALRDNEQDRIMINMLTTLASSPTASQTAVEVFTPAIAAYQALTADVRICTPEAIDDFFESGGTEGIEPDPFAPTGG